MDLSAIGTLYRDDGRMSALSRVAGAGADGSFTETFSKALSSASSASSADRGPEAGARVGKGKAAIDRTDKLYEQCRSLETFVVKNILEGMRRTIQKSELSDTGFAGKMYEDMLYDEYAESLSKNSGFGLADMAYLELSGQRGKSVSA